MQHNDPSLRKISERIDEMNNLVLEKFRNCSKELEGNFSLTEKNNALNNLKIMLTTSQCFYSTLKSENTPKCGNIIEMKMHAISMDLKKANWPLHNSLTPFLEIYQQILENEKVELSLLEVSASPDPGAEGLSQRQTEEILGKFLVCTQERYNELHLEEQMKEEDQECARASKERNAPIIKLKKADRKKIKERKSYYESISSFLPSIKNKPDQNRIPDKTKQRNSCLCCFF